MTRSHTLTILGILTGLLISVGMYSVLSKPYPAESSTSAWVWPLDSGIPISGTLFGTTVENTNYGVKNLDLVRPSTPRITCFGVGFHRIYHAGVDLYVPDENGNNIAEGDSVVAASNGEVTLKKFLGIQDGWVIVISHPQDGVYSAYWHLTEIPNDVEDGADVEAGDFIGKIFKRAYEGRFQDVHPFTEDAHLHFEIRTVPDLLNAYESEACNNYEFEEGVGYTYPNPPEVYGFLDPIAFLHEKLNTSNLYLPVVSRGVTSTCQPNQDLFAYGNPGFEGPTASPAPWIEISTYFDPFPNTTYYYHIVEDDSYQAYSGNHSAIFGDQVFFFPVDEQFLQSVIIPSQTETLKWQAYIKLNRDFSGILEDEFILSLLNAETGKKLADDVVIDYAFNVNEEDVWAFLTIEYDNVGSIAGKRVALSYIGFADGDAHASTLRVDNVQLLTTTCDPNPQSGPIIVNVTVQNNNPTPTPVPPTLTPTPTNTPEPTATPTVTPTPTATPPGDPYEPNNDFDHATPLDAIFIGTQQSRDATISTYYDEDWFVFHVPSGANCPSGICTINAILSNIPAGTNYELALYEDDPNNFIAISDNLSNQSEALNYNFELDTSNGNTFRLQVFSSSGASSTQNYHLTLTVNDFSILAYEPNDKFTDAYDLSLSPGLATEIVAALYPATDEDWFKIYVNASSGAPPPGGQLLTLWLNIPVGANYELALYDSRGHLITASTLPGDTPEYISYQISHTGWYYVRVYPSPEMEQEVVEPYELEILYQE
ncbi:MAG: hypothetical protein Fur0022_40470 [Anaerolineales bacterium]